ncbi:transcription factor BTF34 [Hordeum vulgare]|nr:transcription factor BTF34 [Hordeum vulgare]
MVYTRLSFPPPPADQRHHGVAAALRHPGVHVGRVPLPRHAGVPYPCSPVKFRKKKAVHKTATTDDKRLQSMLKRVGVNTIPAIEEVNIFKDDLVIQFLNPKVNFVCWYELCALANRCCPKNMEHLKRIAEEMQKQVAVARAMQPKEENDWSLDVLCKPGRCIM